MQRPFCQVWPHLAAALVMAFTSRTMAQVVETKAHDPAMVPFRIFRHGVIGGILAGLRTLDSTTDLEVGYLLLRQVCTWPNSWCLWYLGWFNMASSERQTPRLCSLSTTACKLQETIV